MDEETLKTALAAEGTDPIECPVCGDEIRAYELSTDHAHTRELLAVVADLLPDDTAAGPGHHGGRSAATIDSTFIRECLECGKTIEITVYEDDTYEGGHYFGEVTVPDEDSDGEYETTGEWKDHDVMNWTGEANSFEYWECDDCYCSRNQ